MLCRPLPYISMSLPQMRVCPSSLPPHPRLQAVRDPVWVPWAIQPISPGYLFYTWNNLSLKMWGETKDLNKCSWLCSLHKKTLEVFLLLPQYKEFKQHLNYLFLKSCDDLNCESLTIPTTGKDAEQMEFSHTSQHFDHTENLLCRSCDPTQQFLSGARTWDGNTSTKPTLKGDSSFTQNGQTLETHMSINRKTDTIQ